MPVTCAQIAARAGVSKAAVSCALRGRPNIPPRTRDRIRRLARELGYQPNPLVSAHMAHLRALKKPRYRATIAYLRSQPAESPGEAELQERYLRGCRRRAAELGFMVEPFAAPAGEMTPVRLSGILVARGIQGIVVPPLPSPEGRIELEWERFSAAALGYSLQDPDLHRACHHNFHTMGELLHRLSAMGYRRIGLAMSRFADGRVNHLWLGGYLAHGYYLPEQKRIPPLVTSDWRPEVFFRWFESHRPDVVVSSTTDALGWLRGAGFRVPADVGFANVFNTQESGSCSGYDQNFELIGAAAVDLVVSQLNQNERGVPKNPAVLLVNGRWVPGRTLRRNK